MGAGTGDRDTQSCARHLRGYSDNDEKRRKSAQPDAYPAVPAGTSVRRSNTAGITVTGINIGTVAESVDVRILWNNGNQATSADEVTTRVARSAGPTSATAANTDGNVDHGGPHHRQVAGANSPDPGRARALVMVFHRAGNGCLVFRRLS